MPRSNLRNMGPGVDHKQYNTPLPGVLQAKKKARMFTWYLIAQLPIIRKIIAGSG